ncbi:MAG: ribosomal subunit interface protein [Planctomycetes bacterium GWF2_41_51]|nr:MAG: ribosomal subunit interface protein [Planctomycetes bacterium GWF2_41_51]HBG28069.1 ribosome-associated translation inhibitor RaiA [Phycisphaerales bacterium]
MDIQIIGKHVTITDTIRERIEEKVSGLPKFYSSVLEIEVIVESNKDGALTSVEIIARAKHNHTFVAKTDGADIYACVDDVVKKIERQLVKQKQKERDNKHGTM